MTEYMLYNVGYISVEYMVEYIICRVYNL